MNTKVKKITQAFLLTTLFFTSNQQCSAGLWERTGEILQQSGEFLLQLARHPKQFFTAQTNYLLKPNQNVFPRTAEAEIKYQDGKIDLINKQQKEIQGKIDGKGIMWFKTPGLDPKTDSTQVATLQKAKICLEEAKGNAEQVKKFLEDTSTGSWTKQYPNYNAIAAHGVQTQGDVAYLDTFTHLKESGTQRLDTCFSTLGKDSPQVKEYQTAFSNDIQEGAQLASNHEALKFATRHFLEKVFANPYVKAAGIITGGALVSYAAYKTYYYGLLYLYRKFKQIRETDLDREINRLTTEIATKSNEIQNILTPPAAAATPHAHLEATAIAGIATRREQITRLTRNLARYLEMKENCKKWFPWIPFIRSPFIEPIPAA